MERLRQKAATFGIELSDHQLEQFEKYYEILIEKNKVMNLTAITEKNEVIDKHFADSLALIKSGVELNDQRILDLGTGAGFPGIPLKIAFPNLEIVLLDSLNKRIKFLNEVVTNNNLNNITAIHGRVEELGHNKTYREGFDVVTSRAVAKLNVLVEYMLPFVKVGGRCICLKGPNIEEEIKNAENALKLLGGEINRIEELTLPGTEEKRTIIEILSVKHSPNKFPRKPGTPTNSPL